MTTHNIHPTALVDTQTIGDHPCIDAFSIISTAVTLGQNVRIDSHCFLDQGVSIGDRTIIQSGVKIYGKVLIGHDVFIGPGVCFTQHPLLRSQQSHHKHNIEIENNAFIGANTILHPGITVGQGSVIEAGSVVSQSVPPYAIVQGAPAKIKGYVDSHAADSGLTMTQETPFPIDTTPLSLPVRGVTLHRFKIFGDIRGDLSVGEFPKDIPFEPKRYFLVFNVPSEKTRGEHAHYQCQQFLNCIKGSCSVVVDDGNERAQVLLDSPDKGIYLPPLTWGIQYQYSSDAVLLVFASHHYDANDYIRNYDQFLDTVHVKHPK